MIKMLKMELLGRSQRQRLHRYTDAVKEDMQSVGLTEEDVGDG